MSSSSTGKAFGKPTAIGISIGVVCLLIIALGALAVYIRNRRSSNFVGEFTSLSDQNQLALRVTPFGSPGGEMPRYGFARTPGSDMRIAHRQEDGSWSIADNHTPFSPTGVSDLDVMPSPVSPRFPSVYSSPKLSAKERDAKSRTFGKGHPKDDLYDIDATILSPPPPAYGSEVGYLDPFAKD